MTLHFNYHSEIIKVSGHDYWWLVGGYDLETGYLEWLACGYLVDSGLF